VLSDVIVVVVEDVVVMMVLYIRVSALMGGDGQVSAAFDNLI
jgi:hypothetical protein